ncbi:hypothetical protein SAMN05444336_104371 [Albimonas donghaensis]|uniref:DUF2092 domain-containing protein n=1 Tax=Albimonas donghaensis TaxID=356660 RepID=A0A1H3AYL4_9RHOB|nr:DUF2092 domain-containing protein [Albimonas donghaensis]SDX34777.1 hypothetical protein SAMN05444336_104371 [Albimonas donghaensis]
MTRPTTPATWLGVLAAAALLGGGALAQTSETPAHAAGEAAETEIADEAPDALDPIALEVLKTATDYLAAQRTLSVDWFVSRDRVIDGREKLTEFTSGGIILDREAGFVAHSENGPEGRNFYYDREAVFIQDIEANAYVTAAFEGELEALVARIKDEYDVVLPIWSVLSRDTAAEFIDAADKAAYVGRTRVAGRDAHHLAFSNYDYDWQVWVADDADRPEILMIVGTDPYTQGWPQYRAYLTNWDFAPEIDPTEFTYVPEADAERMAWPKIADIPAHSGTE